MPLSPVPTAIVRKPLRFTLTGTAWSASVISTASAVSGPTRTTWPTTPCASINAWPTYTPSTKTAVQVEALAVGIEVHVENLGDQRAAADARLRIEQLAQPRVLHLERREPLQAKLGVQPLALEGFVFRDERLARREVGAHRRPAAERHVDEHANRIDENGQRLGGRDRDADRVDREP